MDDPLGAQGSLVLPRLGESLRGPGRAFITGGDWNATPSEFAQQGCACKQRGRSVAPSDIACRSGKGRDPDDFALSGAL
eukprot:9496758-Pyramimonas_sp.AAC.1